MSNTILAKGANVNAADNLGRTPLHLAALKGRREVVVLLVAQGANLQAKDKMLELPYDSAMSWQRTVVAEYIRQHGG